MNYKIHFHKVFLLVVLQIFFISISAFAAPTEGGDSIWQNTSIMDHGLSELSIDHSQLFTSAIETEVESPKRFAMAGTSGYKQGSREARLNTTSLASWHKYLGYATVLMAGVTAVSSSSEDFHESAAYVTAAGAISTLLTGYLGHGQRFDTDRGLFSKDNLHIALGTLGAVALTSAVVFADDGKESSHSGLGAAGGVLMTLGVINIKW